MVFDKSIKIVHINHKAYFFVLICCDFCHFSNNLVAKKWGVSIRGWILITGTEYMVNKQI